MSRAAIAPGALVAFPGPEAAPAEKPGPIAMLRAFLVGLHPATVRDRARRDVAQMLVQQVEASRSMALGHLAAAEDAAEAAGDAGALIRIREAAKVILLLCLPLCFWGALVDDDLHLRRTSTRITVRGPAKLAKSTRDDVAVA